MKKLNLIPHALLILILLSASINAEAQTPAGWPNKFKRYIYQTYNGSTWDTVSCNTAAYNTDKTLKTIITTQKKDSVYINYSKDSFSYTLQSPLILTAQSIHTVWFYNKWNVSQKTLYTYDADSRIQTRLYSNYQSGNWTPASMDSNEYDTYGRLTKVYHTTYSNSFFNNSSMDSFAFDAAWRVTYRYIKLWDGKKYSLDKREVFTYNAGGFLLSIKTQQYAAGYYIDISRYYFEYDANMTSAGENTNSPVTEVSVYPNPSRDFVNIIIAGENAGDVKVRVFDMSGKEYSLNNYTGSGNIKLDISDMPLGVYLLNIISGDKTYISKIIKN